LRPFHYITFVFFFLAGIITIGAMMFALSLWWLVLIAVIYVHTLVLGAIYIRWNFYMVSYDRGNNDKWIALSFDDGPARETEAILDILKEQNVRAAFFSIGKNAAASPELVKRWDAEGHLIGNHSYSHGFNFDWQSAHTMAKEIADTNKVISGLTGKSPRLFRPPYGVTNPNLARAVRKTNMYSVGWNIRSFDTKAKDPQALLTRILTQIKGGDIILLHDSMAITKQILTELIDTARANGFTFVRIDKLLELDPYA
jgi:peptidoglycan-N-acetylglucosamine deacetylase